MLRSKIVLPHLFVYGTLRPAAAGRFAQQLLARSSYLGKAYMSGSLYLVGQHYPGFVPGPEGQVTGELYVLHDPKVLIELDDYEGCGSGDPEPHEFVRMQGPARTSSGREVLAWFYRYNWPVREEQRIPSGDFFQSTQEKP